LHATVLSLCIIPVIGYGGGKPAALDASRTVAYSTMGFGMPTAGAGFWAWALLRKLPEASRQAARARAACFLWWENTV